MMAIHFLFAFLKQRKPFLEKTNQISGNKMQHYFYKSNINSTIVQSGKTFFCDFTPIGKKEKM